MSRLACLTISLLALGLIFHRIHLANVGHALAHARLRWVLAGTAVFGLSLFLAAARWHLVLRLNQSQVHAASTVRVVLIGHFFNTILFGPTGGDIAKTALYARTYGFATSSILATCLLDRFLGGIGFVLFACCTPGLALQGGHWSGRVTQLISPHQVRIAAALAILVAGAAWFFGRRLDVKGPMRRFMAAFLSNAAQLWRQPSLAVRGILYAMAANFCISCVFLFALKAVTHTSFSWPALFWTFPVISLITSAPVTFSGAGLREGAALVLLGLYGIPADDAVTAAVLVLLVYMAWAVIGAWILWRARVWSVAPTLTSARTISVVIPALNEELALPETVRRAQAVAEVVEIIVVDGGSGDQTVPIARELGCKVLEGVRGRGAQLRLGASHAAGDVVVLLHADTWLPPESGQALLNCLRDPVVAGGGFWKVFRERRAIMAGSRLRCAVRLLLFRRILGDQAMFIRRAALEAIGGVPDLPLMEEFELCRRLRSQGSLALAGATVVTSARRFAKLGVLRTYLRMAHVTARYYLGAPTQKLRELYERD